VEHEKRNNNNSYKTLDTPIEIENVETENKLTNNELQNGEET